MKKRLHDLFLKTREKVDRWWYPFLISFLAFIDAFVFIVPTDGLIVSSILIRPQRWFRIFFSITMGSILAGIFIIYLFHWYGEDFLTTFMPGLIETWAWTWTEEFFSSYGLLVVFLAAASPFSFQPALFFAVVADGPLSEIIIMFVAGRIVKNSIISVIAAQAPQYLTRIWGLRSDLEEMEVR